MVRGPRVPYDTNFVELGDGPQATLPRASQSTMNPLLFPRRIFLGGPVFKSSDASNSKRLSEGKKEFQLELFRDVDPQLDEIPRELPRNQGARSWFAKRAPELRPTVLEFELNSNIRIPGGSQPI